MMTYAYSPLQEDEIRLLELEPLDGDAVTTSTIRCSLEHVTLSPQSKERLEPGFKGENYVWPEIHAACNTSSLFRKSPDPSAPPKCFPTAISGLKVEGCLPTDKDRPWRHDWGDYIALSYTWGASEALRTITLNGQPFSVSPNLFDALLLLRCSQRVQQGFKLWIDAICINQADLGERSRQVVRMLDIYASAWQVVTYLGPEANASELAMTAFRWFAARTEEAEDPLQGFYREPTRVNIPVLGSMTVSWSSVLRDDVYKAIYFFLTRPYWRRMWILQEMASAREDAPVACGNGYLSWKQVFGAAKFISLDEGRFHREVFSRARPKETFHGTFEFARGRLLEETDWSLLLDMLDLQRSQARKQDSQRPMDFLKLLLLARKADVTDDKDRVYGILGFRSVIERVSIAPDYTLSVSEVYRNFGEELLSKGDLNVLRLVSRYSGKIYSHGKFGKSLVIRGKPIINSLLSSMRKGLSKEPQKQYRFGDDCTHDIPSWIVCWRCKPAPTAELRGRYRAGGESKPLAPVFSGWTVRVRGVIIDTIGSLGSSHPAEIDATYPTNDPPPFRSAYGGLEATRTAFWRTVVANSTAGGISPAPESYSCLLDRQLWKFGVSDVEANGFGLHEVMARNEELVLSGYTLVELACGPTKERRSIRKESRKALLDNEHVLAAGQLEALEWAMNVLAWRRLAGTIQGRIGLAPGGAEVGDKIAVLVGCDVPMVLRWVVSRDGWLVVGECYLHGVMNGEAVNVDTGNVGDVILL